MMRMKLFQYKYRVLFASAALFFMTTPLVTFAEMLNPAQALQSKDPYSVVLGGITTLLFIATFTFIAALTLLAIAVMLLIRYVYLTVLLILSPLIWLAWILPGTQQYWIKWWHNFMRWVFFAPVMLFFIYLVVAIVQKYPGMIVSQLHDIPAQGFFAVDVKYIGNLVALIGLLLGGLFTANALGIAGAKTFMGWAQGTGKWVGSWAGRKGLRLATYPLRKKVGKEGEEKGIPETLMGVGAQRGKFWRTLTAPIRYTGAGLSRVASFGAEQLVAKRTKELGTYDKQRLAQMLHTLDKPGQIAALQILANDKSLDLIPGGEGYVSQDMLNAFKAYQVPVPIFNNIQRGFGFNIDMLKAAQGGGSFQRPDGTRVTLAEATQKFYRSFRPEHFNKMQVDEFFHKIDPAKRTSEFGLDPAMHEMLQREVVAALLETNPDGIANIFHNLKSENLDNFSKVLDGHMDAQQMAGKFANRRAWLESDPKYKRLLTFLDSPAARSLGISIL